MRDRRIERLKAEREESEKQQQLDLKRQEMEAARNKIILPN